MDGAYSFPLYSTGLWPLWSPLGPLPCSPDSYHHEILDQGKGADDQLTISCLWATGLKSNKITRSNRTSKQAMKQPMQSTWQSGGFFLPMQITRRMGKSTAKSFAPTPFPSFSSIMEMVHNTSGLIWPLQTMAGLGYRCCRKREAWEAQKEQRSISSRPIKKDKEKPVAQRQEMGIGTFALV